MSPLGKQLKTLTHRKTILQAIEILGLLIGGEINIQEFFLFCFPFVSQLRNPGSFGYYKYYL